MNTPLDRDQSQLRYAEYVLGVLDADARAEVASEVQTSDEAATAVNLWHRRLQPMSEEIPPIEPPDHVWARIQQALRFEARERARIPPARAGLWENLRFWHWLGLGASAMAAACLLLLVVTTGPRIAPSSSAIPFMASSITQTGGHVGWTATMDIQQARMIVVPVAPTSFAQGKAPQLWLVPSGQKPISIGMIATNAPTALKLDRALLAQLGPTAALAVSVEPVGGSPTGQPTGPVVATGAIGAAQG
ncbi:Anti-sigma-K factor RskA [Dyella sp. AD56]|uniref:anti-sigma factor n=1 Tax=Dyella sp. AD56 TaxID=1528744 RepID=UPI000C86672B|nr:anti-sigma factor [Dyella sp. AD56]PMQ06678.1 Anti-sigma-K factor RskA [Dyella sp. AD56]